MKPVAVYPTRGAIRVYFTAAVYEIDRHTVRAVGRAWWPRTSDDITVANDRGLTVRRGPASITLGATRVA